MYNPEFLLPTQKKSLLTFIQAAYMEPTDFEWRLDTGILLDKRASLVHKKSKYYFTINLGFPGKTWSCRYSPGKETVEESPDGGDWSLLISHFQKWLKWLRIESATPDVWALLSENSTLSESIDLINDSDMFTQEEQKRISEGIGEIKQFLKASNEFNKEQFQHIEDRLGEMEEASQKFGKKDWIIYVIGIITTIVLQLSVTPDTSRELFKLVSSLFNWVYTDYLPLPL